MDLNETRDLSPLDQDRRLSWALSRREIGAERRGETR